MNIGDTFVIDAQAITDTAAFTKTTVADLEKKFSVGDTFSISKKNRFTSSIIYGTRWVAGKPQKGRPRRFPRATVARLLGFDDSAFVETNEVELAVVPVVDEVALENRAAALLEDDTTEAVAEVPAEVTADASDDVSW